MNMLCGTNNYVDEALEDSAVEGGMHEMLNT